MKICLFFAIKFWVIVFKPRVYKLTESGAAILQLNYYCQRILSHKAFYEATRLYFDRGQMPDKAEIVTIMKDSNLYHVESESTYTRRVSTVRARVEWIAGLI